MSFQVKLSIFLGLVLIALLFLSISFWWYRRYNFNSLSSLSMWQRLARVFIFALVIISFAAFVGAITIWIN